MPLDVKSIRNQFPILQRTLPNGKKLVYFDNAATSQKPLAVIDAMSDFYKNYHANAQTKQQVNVHTKTHPVTNALQNAAQWT